MNFVMGFLLNLQLIRLPPWDSDMAALKDVTIYDFNDLNLFLGQISQLKGDFLMIYKFFYDLVTSTVLNEFA